VERDVNVLIDGRRDQETGVLLKIRWEIGAAASKRNAQWGTSDDHQP
jgi:hypothetical protein